MSNQKDPTKPTSNDEKFKPQNVADESAGNLKSGGRLDRHAAPDIARGSEPDTRGSAQNRR